MYYINSQGEKVTVENVYGIDITSDILAVGKRKVKSLATGWFSASAGTPTAVFYMLSSTLNEYFSGKPSAVKFTYYFEVRAKKERERDDMAKALCGQLATIYHARRSQYADSFETATNTYVKRITFTFTVEAFYSEK